MRLPAHMDHLLLNPDLQRPLHALLHLRLRAPPPPAEAPQRPPSATLLVHVPVQMPRRRRRSSSSSWRAPPVAVLPGPRSRSPRLHLNNMKLVLAHQVQSFRRHHSDRRFPPLFPPLFPPCCLCLCPRLCPRLPFRRRLQHHRLVFISILQSRHLSGWAPAPAPAPVPAATPARPASPPSMSLRPSRRPRASPRARPSLQLSSPSM